MPRLYAWVMTLATVPGITLALFAIGLAVSVLAVVPAWRKLVIEREARVPPVSVQAEASTPLLWLLCLLMCYAPWWSELTPIFGGTKHWMTAYPFLCLFAGRGFAFAARRIAELVPWKRALPFTPYALAGSVLLGPLCMLLHSHPWGLSFYTPLVGGTPGAASLGLNRSFWGYTTGAEQGFINAQAPAHANVYVHDTALQSWEALREDGRIRDDLRGSLSIAGSSLALYHQEAHMHRVEYQVWVDYGHDAPADVGTFDGVPIIWVYSR
jgi:hypothetical protein